MKEVFISSLENNDLEQLRKIPKGDLHNHAPRGSNVKFIEEWYHETINKPPAKFSGLNDMQLWYERYGIELKEYPKYLQNAGFAKVNIDTISVVPYAPDNHNVYNAPRCQDNLFEFLS